MPLLDFGFQEFLSDQKDVFKVAKSNGKKRAPTEAWPPLFLK
jgi:hypothetical protein